VPGLETERVLTFRSAVAPIAVVAEPLPSLFPVFVSVRCSWSTEVLTEAEKLWLDAFEHVTDQVIFTGVAVDTGREVS
jgi:hypothetical protein